jgi:hypothetical protein
MPISSWHGIRHDEVPRIGNLLYNRSQVPEMSSVRVSCAHPVPTWALRGLQRNCAMGEAQDSAAASAWIDPNKN